MFQIIDVQAMFMLLEMLEADKATMNDVTRRREWMERVELYSPFIEQMLHTLQQPPPDMHPFGDVSMRAAAICRCVKQPLIRRFQSSGNLLPFTYDCVLSNRIHDSTCIRTYVCRCTCRCV